MGRVSYNYIAYNTCQRFISLVWSRVNTCPGRLAKDLYRDKHRKNKVQESPSPLNIQNLLVYLLHGDCCFNISSGHAEALVTKCVKVSGVEPNACGFHVVSRNTDEIIVSNFVMWYSVTFLTNFDMWIDQFKRCTFYIHQFTISCML
jgi:hypothetical protein